MAFSCSSAVGQQLMSVWLTCTAQSVSVFLSPNDVGGSSVP